MMTTWNELTPGQQAYLDDRARYGGKWEIVSNSFYVSGIKPEDHRQLLHDFHFIEMADDLDDLRFVHERITPAGLLVWQQGQTPAEPDELTRLREQVSALTAERDALKAQLESIEIHHAASWEAGYYAGFAAGKQTTGNE